MLEMYKCSHCGNIVVMAHNSGVPVVCCGEPMNRLEANTVDAAREKHVPVVNVDGSKVSVRVGSVEHPMMDEHYIELIILETENSLQIRYLKPTDKPESVFSLADGDKAVAVYEYCNLHGLWKTAL